MVLSTTPKNESATPLSLPQTVERYFQTFNNGNFQATSQLFAAVGRLLPPFEDPVIGHDAIYAYLKQEAAGMRATPKATTIEFLTEGRQRVIVKGKVKAIVFSVSAAWIFDLDSNGRIEQVEVKLLASLQELLTLRPA
ncbi:MAG: nuclear transport factor 2 family protein [Cyanobacteria bacterium J06559_3]